MSKKTIDPSISKGKCSTQSRKSRANPRGSEAAAAAPRSHPRKKARGQPKLVADPIESQTHVSKTSKHKTRRPKAPLTLTAENSSLPPDSQPTVFSGESRSRHSQEQYERLGQSVALTKEALEEHTRSYEPVALADQIRAIKRVSGRGIAPEARSSDTVDIDPQEEFNCRWGFLPPLGEEAERIIIAVLEDPKLAEIMVRTGPNSKRFRTGLEKRNVVISESRDPDLRVEEIGGESIEGFLEETTDQQRIYDDLWQLDRDKCNLSSSEALFQRTLMISLIARHSLIYRQNTGGIPLLDFVVEEPWNCLPMPTKTVWRVPENLAKDFKFLTQPKPDLAVCFDRHLALPEDVWTSLPEATQALACFENSDAGASRIFHFLTVEAKKAIIRVEEPKALYQCLNNASQALHNMFEFFRDAGPQHEKIFFDKVRFFSAVANGEGILIRIHRAIQLSHKDSRLFVMPDEPNYRLRFVYKKFELISGTDNYSRARVLTAFKKILKYAINDLSRWIKDAASDLADKFERDPQAFMKREELDFYRYGQPSPKPSRQTYQSAEPSMTNGTLSLAKRFENAEVNYNPALTEHTVMRKQRTPTEEGIQASSLLKRSGGNQIEDESSISQMPPESPARKRRRVP